MLGSAADFARCVSQKMSESGGFKTLICFEPEVHGQDSAAVGLTAANQKIRILSQYKYSANPTKYPIGPGELGKIVATLKKSEKEANKSEPLPTKLVLRTNRRITSRAKKDSAYNSITVEEYEAAGARKELESYAATFGLFNPDELDQGMRRVTSYLFDVATGLSTRLTKSTFNENLVGHKEPRSIAIDVAAPERRRELGDLALTLGLDPARIVRRESFEAASMEWIDDAIVVFFGDGGCGKTTALWQILWDAINAQPPQILAHLMLSQAETPQSFGAVIERWRGILTATASASDDLAIERIKRANPTHPLPIVLLGLDGIDEAHLSPSWESTVARVLGFFWKLHVFAKQTGEAPPARLFVTCRRKVDCERLLPAPTGAGIGNQGPRYVRFGDFSNGELEEVLQQSRGRVDPKVVDRVLQSLVDGGRPFATYSGSRALTLPSASLAPDVLQLLKHPILWRSFSALDAAAQNTLLDGSTDARDRLGAVFLEWFCDRIKHRLKVEVAYVPVALRSLAIACPDSGATYNLEVWFNCMRSAAGFAENHAQELYQESLSSGLVQDVPPAGGSMPIQRLWRWKQVFLAEYLRRLGN
jgi:hypothetical protein